MTTIKAYACSSSYSFIIRKFKPYHFYRIYKSDINMVSLLLSNSKSTILHDETILSSFLEKLQEYTNNNIPVITKYVTFFLI